ncbi:hypothetical protein GCM10027445_31450 [Amycolatopsis endophytica]|uniref:Uncharacterized protein (TIGR04141 family) n=1 Tax=Amycolatopsis endophytica TaxID=860233 RepID=A0A853B1D7_9PSEU|nr:DUF6119 family protein [Amycolatopsis endophytica]NYI88769.1 uncharacterized protein (TIGR04141 family) [Amycolatopsis endophytica]
MSGKRSNTAIWKLVVPDDDEPNEVVEQIISNYGKLRKSDPSRYRKLDEIEIEQPFANVDLHLWVRDAQSRGLLPFLKNYLASPEDEDRFLRSSLDVCLFIATETSLFAITSGSGYRIITEYVDYSFPFDTAKKLIANNFKEADVREFTGPRTSRTETYRRGYSISKSESFGKVWKRLVGRLDSRRLGAQSYLRAIVDPTKPPALEFKSSFVLRKSLDLAQLVSLIHELEELPEPSAEEVNELSFLDNLYPVKTKDKINALYRQLIEDLRHYVTNNEGIDLDICDPEDVARYYAGSNFKLAYWDIKDADPPEKEHLREILGKQLGSTILGDQEAFHRRIMSMRMSYSPGDEDDESRKIVHDLHKYFHGQVILDNETYFLLDKVWYRSQGAFLDNLRSDFIEETFRASNPILIKKIPGLLEWSDDDEDGFNRRQAATPDFYYGDKIFAVSQRGKIELFDLLSVDRKTGFST